MLLEVCPPPEQVQPTAGLEQSEKHPVSPSKFPSSQNSFPSTNPSPQIGVHLNGVASSHLKPV